MRIGIVGAGALGLYYGAMLQRAGNEVCFLLRRDYEAIKEQGLTVRSPGGDFHLPAVQGFRTASSMGKVDLVIVAVKTFANNCLAELVAPLLHDETAILTLQNGLGNEELLASLFGAGRILGGVAFLCSNRDTPGTVCHLGAGRIRLGEYVGGGSARANELAALFRHAGVECEAVADLRRARWEKLVWNIPFNGLCALMLRPVDLLLSRERCRALVRDIMLETIAAANGQELTSPIPVTFADEMLVFTDGMGAYRPSMFIDREEGRPMELEAIFGTPLAAGAARGIPMPKTEALFALLELVDERGSAEIAR